MVAEKDRHFVYAFHIKGSDDLDAIQLVGRSKEGYKVSFVRSAFSAEERVCSVIPVLRELDISDVYTVQDLSCLKGKIPFGSSYFNYSTLNDEEIDALARNNVRVISIDKVVSRVGK